MFVVRTAKKADLGRINWACETFDNKADADKAAEAAKSGDDVVEVKVLDSDTGEEPATVSASARRSSGDDA